VSRAQLLAAGFSRRAIAHRIHLGRLSEQYRGVYLVGRPSIEPLGLETAAVLYFDGDAVLSHGTAAALWGITRQVPHDVHVTLVGRDCRPRPGLTVHRVATLDRSDLRQRKGLPVTSPARTVLDLAGELEIDDLESAVAEARVHRLLRPGELEAAMRRAPGRKGMARIRAMLEAEHDPALTRSRAERLTLKLIREARLPEPIVNGRFLGIRPDLRWPREKLVVEFDGRQFHGHALAFERDRRRDQLLVAAGYRVMRLTWTQLVTEPLVVVARIAMALSGH
jgi:very-short-patch-repair endonuclease